MGALKCSGWKANTHIGSLIVTDCARSEGDVTRFDFDAAALCTQEPDVNFSGAMEEVFRRVQKASAYWPLKIE